MLPRRMAALMPEPHSYSTPAALMDALLARSPKAQRSQAFGEFVFDRFLCRIFSEKSSGFVLKGGQALLARTPDARATKDIDLFMKEVNLDNALDELKRLSKTNLPDYLRFEYLTHSSILINREHRSGYRVRFQPYFGETKKLNQISIDLVVDMSFCGKPDLVTPGRRITLEGLSGVDYRLYPIENHISEKICAIMAVYNGRESSRVKDFVDLALILSTKALRGRILQPILADELRLNGLDSVLEFSVPKRWLEQDYSITSARFQEVALPPKLKNPKEAFTNIASCVNPVILNNVEDLRWNYATFKWDQLY